MQQIRIQRKTLKRGGPDETPLEPLPTTPTSDTGAASATLARIDAVLGAA